MSSTTDDSSSHNRIYLYVFGVLAVLTVVTVTAGSLSLPAGLGIVIALIIASVKGSLVAAYFMHLVSEQKPVLWLMVATLILLLTLFGLFILAFYDQGDIGHVA